MQQLETTKLAHPASFDRQAIAYDCRTGLSEKTCSQIVEAIVKIANLKSEDLVVEVGAGTGQIGQWFGRSHIEVRYLGFDLSEAMLAQFHQRLPEGKRDFTLLQADGNQPWPVSDGAARVIFGSRSLHLLDRDRVVTECLRIAHPDGATLFIGSIERQEDSVKARMRKQMRQLLKQKGLQGREKNRQQLVELFRQHPAIAPSPTEDKLEDKLEDKIIVAEWTVSHTPRQSLESWQNKDGLAGISPPAAIEQEVLRELQTWAEVTFGSLDIPIESQEIYLLHSVQIDSHL